MSIRYYKPLIKKIVKQKESLEQENIKDFIIYLANNEYKIEIVNENKEKKEVKEDDEKYIYFIPFIKRIKKMAKHVSKEDLIIMKCKIDKNNIYFRIDIYHQIIVLVEKEKTFFINISTYFNFLNKPKFKIIKVKERKKQEFFPFSLYDDRSYV